MDDAKKEREKRELESWSKQLDKYLKIQELANSIMDILDNDDLEVFCNNYECKDCPAENCGENEETQVFRLAEGLCFSLDCYVTDIRRTLAIYQLLGKQED